MQLQSTKNYSVTNPSMSCLQSPQTQSTRHLATRSALLHKCSNVHERLYMDHLEHRQRRSSIYDPCKREQEEEVAECTFQPSCEKSKLLGRSNSFCATSARNRSQFLADMNNYQVVYRRKLAYL